MFTGIDHVVLHVSHFEACRAVYTTLGLQETARGVDRGGNRVCLLAVGSSALELHEDPTARPAIDPATGKPLNSMFTDTIWVNHIAFHVKNAHAVYAELGDSGIPWKVAPQNQPVGHHMIRRRLLEFDDPDLFTVQLAELIDAEGRSLEAADPPSGGPDALRPRCDKLDHISLPVTDMLAKRAFYVERLGLKEFLHRPTKWGEECTVTAGETAVELSWHPRFRPPLHGGTGRGLAFATDDLDRTYQTLAARGVAVTPPAAESPLPGIRRRTITFQDPDGLPLKAVSRA